MQFKKTTLTNGLRIITVPMKDNPAVTVLVMAETGSKYEQKSDNGISHFLEHMMFKGTSRRPKALDIARELDSIGAQYNAFTGQEYTGYYAKAAVEHIDTILDVVSDIYLNPLFDAAEIEKEKGVIVEEIRMYRDMPHRHVQDLFIELLYGDQPAGWNIAGSEDTVKSFRRDDFMRYRGEHYVASATTIIIAGAFDEEKVLAQVQAIFCDIPTSKKSEKLPVVEKQSSPNILVHSKETDQTHMVLGVRSFPVTSPHIPTLRVIAALLGGGMSSRLFQKLRNEMGVGYYVHADQESLTDHGVFAVSTGVDNAKVDLVVEAVLAEFKKMTTEEVPVAELRKAKDYLSGTLALSLESSDAQAEFCAFQEILKKDIKYPADIAQEIEKVSAADIMRVARLIFTNDRLNLALIGRPKDKAHFEAFFKM